MEEDREREGRRECCCTCTSEIWALAIGWLSLGYSCKVFISQIVLPSGRISKEDFIATWKQEHVFRGDVTDVDIERAWAFLDWLLIKPLNMLLATINILMCVVLIKGVKKREIKCIQAWLLYSSFLTLFGVVLLVAACIVVTPLFGWDLTISVTVIVLILNVFCTGIVAVHKRELDIESKERNALESRYGQYGVAQGELETVPL